MKEEFINKLREALEMEDRAEVNLSDNFRDYENWDSLNRLNLIAMLDDEYGVQIENEEFENLKTVGDLLEVVKNNKNN